MSTPTTVQLYFQDLDRMVALDGFNSIPLPILATDFMFIKVGEILYSIKVVGDRQVAERFE